MHIAQIMILFNQVEKNTISPKTKHGEETLYGIGSLALRQTRVHNKLQFNTWLVLFLVVCQIIHELAAPNSFLCTYKMVD